jgi:glycoside/pentoside/hexuronide:cation symporter, GPH family
VKYTNLGWGMGSLGTITMINSVAALYLFFLVSVVGMEPALAGLILFASKIIDIISDPLMGWISDRTNSRWGRRRPFMLGASLLCGLSMGLLFSLPDFSSDGLLYAYVFFLLAIYTLALTAFNVPYLAMPAEMTDDYHERSRIMSYRAFFLVSGSFMGTAGAGLLLTLWGRDAIAYGRVGWVLGAVAAAAMLICVFSTAKARFTTYRRPSVPWINQLRILLVNRPFHILGGVKALQFLQLASGTTATLFFFLAVYGKAEELLFPFGVSVMIGSILGLRAWLAVSMKLGKREMFMIALCFYVLAYLTWLLADGSDPLWMLMLRGLFLGLSSGGIVMCSQSMITDVIDYDRRLSGLNREGVFSATFSFIEKTTYALGPLIVGTLLSVYGYDSSIPRGQPQPDTAMFAVAMGQIWIPIVCCIAQFLLLFGYRLDEVKLNATRVHALGEQAVQHAAEQRSPGAGEAALPGIKPAD